MMNVKELFENEELMESIVEDIEDIPEDSEVTYEVWAFGYDEDENFVDSYLIKEFPDPDVAVEYAKNFTLEKFEAEYESSNCTIVRLGLEVETVVPDPDNEGTMNIGTIYNRDLWIADEPGTEEDPCPVVELTTGSYELLKDGTIKVSCELLKDFNKNDYVSFAFVDSGSWPPAYKIVSKVEYEDGDYFHCDFIG